MQLKKTVLFQCLIYDFIIKIKNINIQKLKNIINQNP